MITSKELDRLQKLCDGATAGPWEADGPGTNTYDRVTSCVPEHTTEVAYDILHDGDALFIAAARTALPELIAEVRRLQERCAAAERDRKAALFGEIGSPCNVCAKYGMAQCLLYCDFEWRGPQPAKEDS